MYLLVLILFFNTAQYMNTIYYRYLILTIVTMYLPVIIGRTVTTEIHITET